jgi:hypothetical protein
MLYGTDDLSSGRKPRLLCSHRRSPLCGRLSAAACAPYSAGGIDLGCGGNVKRVRLRPQYVAAQRETSASPWRSGYGDTSSPRSFRARAGFYGQLAWSWLSDVPFFSFLYVNVDALKAWTVSSLPFADFIAPADCSSWKLCLRQSTVLGGTDVAVAPGSGRHHCLSFLMLTYPPSPSRLRDTSAFGPGF